MAPTVRAAWMILVAAVAALLLHVVLAATVAVALMAAFVADARSARRPPRVTRRTPSVLARGVPAHMEIGVRSQAGLTVRVRQPRPPDFEIVPNEDVGGLDSVLVARRRGKHTIPGVATATVGPLGLARRHHPATEPVEVSVYPDLPAARRLAVAVRQGRFRDPGRRPRGPLGLGTDFESVRDYVPDDDIRQVNWRATARLGRPMSNQYRVEQDRVVMCLVDTGRLMSAPLPNETDRLDVALDCVTAVALVAQELGDRCGVIAFSDRIRRHVRPRRRGADATVGAIFDLETEPVDSDYELAFKTVRSGKRAFVLVLTDLLDPAAAAPLVRAVPVLARKHALAVASATDPDIDPLLRSQPTDLDDVLRQAVALEVAEARRQAAAAIRGSGADVLEADAGSLAVRCVGAYLRAKASARL